MNKKELMMLQHVLAMFLQKQKEVDEEYIDLYFKITELAIKSDKNEKEKIK